MFSGFPGGSDGKESACSSGEFGLIPGLGRSPREESGYPLSIFVWRMAQTEETSRLQSMGL